MKGHIFVEGLSPTCAERRWVWAGLIGIPWIICSISKNPVEFVVGAVAFFVVRDAAKHTP
jgi:hypothetical protein